MTPAYSQLFEGFRWAIQRLQCVLSSSSFDISLILDAVPTLLSTLFVSILIVTFMDSPKPHHGKYRAPESGILGTLVYSVGAMLVGLPTAIVTYRYVFP